MKPSIQWVRHFIQFSVILFILVMPLIAQYGEYLYQHKLDHVLDTWPSSFQKNSLSVIENIYHATDPGADRDKILISLANVRGNNWSAQIYGLSLTDLLAGLGSLVASRSISTTLVLGLIVPLIVTLLLGRVFCSWICPIGFMLEMTEKLKRALHALKIRTKNIPFGRGHKYILLAVGLLISYLAGTALLNELYPPALIGREIQNETQFLFEQAQHNQFGFNPGGLTGISLFIFSIMLLELFVCERLWCRYLCPGGALYSLVGSQRLIRIRRDAVKCTDCADCTKVCPVGLNPMRDSTGMECDNCLACVSVCSEDALTTHLSLKSTPIGSKKNV